MTELIWDDLDRQAVDTARLLAADAVEKVGNGHPGTAMSLAPVAYLLHQKVMAHDPSDPHWLGRDRFILSPATARSRSTCSSTWALRPRARRPQGAPHVGLEEPPATPSTATPTASRSRRARSARASPPRSASPTPPASITDCP